MENIVETRFPTAQIEEDGNPDSGQKDAVARKKLCFSGRGDFVAGISSTEPICLRTGTPMTRNALLGTSEMTIDGFRAQCDLT